MRTDLPIARGPIAARLRAELGRLRRRFMARPPAWRRSLALAALVAVAALAYAASGTPAPAVALVRSGQRFAADDLIAAGKALDAKHLRYRIDDRRRIEVAADQLDAANDALAKLDIGPRPLADIEVRAFAGPWAPMAEAAFRRDRATCATLEELIRPMDGVVAAHVIVNRPRPRGFNRAQPATAFVYVETEDNAELSGATVDSIQGLIAGAVPEVPRDAVSVFDRKGRHYLDASDPAHGSEMKARRRRDELRQEILEHLGMIKGVAVSVQLVAAPAAAAAAPAPTPAPAPAPAPPASEEPALPPTSVGVNQPLELPDDAVVMPAPPEEPAPTPAPATVAAQGSMPAPEPRAKVWVKVPRSYYLRAMAPNREPSLDDLQPFMERTKGLIETAVRHVVPSGQLDEPVVISTIPDDLPAERASPAPPAASEPRRLPVWWGIGAAGLAGSLTLLLIVAARQPALRPASRLRGEVHGRYKIDEPSDSGPGPGPSERVRELIRSNPEAAASVLHRWTGQGEGGR